MIASFTANTVEIPRSNKIKAQDEKIEKVREFLRNPEQALAFSDQDIQQFVRYATDFFILDGQLWRKDRQGKHKLVITKEKRLDLMKQAHDDLGHKGMFTVRTRLSERFWWPGMEEDIKWFVQTCHECQTRLVKKIVILPAVPTPAGLFQKVYIDTMLMPNARGYRYIIHARCSLSSFPEWAALRNENFKAIAKFVFEVLLCRWGAMKFIVSDNAPQYI